MKPEELQGLVKAYTSIYTDLSESHYKVGDKVTCKESGMTGKVVEVDPEEKGKYYTVDREDGKKVKYAPEELKKSNGGVSKKEEEKFHSKLDKLVHKSFGKSPEEQKEEVEVILSYLLDEGYADNEKAAETIAENMSDEWKKSILEAHPLDRQRLAIQQRRPVPTIRNIKPKPKKETVAN